MNNKRKISGKLNNPAREFVQILRNELKERLLIAILFGSRARGNFNNYSDYDILLVVDKHDKKLKNTVLECSVNILNKYDALIGFILCEQRDWSKQQKFPIGLNILNDGVEL